VTATGSPAPAISESGFLPSGITFNATTNTLAGTPPLGMAGIYDEIVFTATNGTGAPGTQTFTLIINAAAKAPEFAVNTMAVGPGIVNQVPLAGTYLPGTVIQLTAIPNAGATFQGRSGSGGCTGMNPGCTITVGQMNLVPIATFVAASGMPTIVVTPASATGTPGQMFTFT
jgi:Putative Ig domain/Divergent InlB B-repeat domain